MKKIFVPLLIIMVALKTEAQSSVFSVVDSLLLKGNYQVALIQLEKEHIKTAKIYGKIASIYQSIGDFNKAIQYYEKALVIEEKESLKVKLGVSYNSAGFPSKAIALYEDIIKKDTSNLLVAHSLGKLYLAKNKAKRAVKIYRFLNIKDSLNPNYPYQLGKALEKQGKHLKMGQSYLDAFNIDTLHLKSIYELSKFFKELRVKDSTMLFIEKGLKIDSTNVNFIQLKANVLYFAKDFEGAIEQLTKLDSLNFKSINTYEMFGMCYYKLKNLELAEEYFKKALRIDRINSKINYRLGSLYYEKKDLKLAHLYLAQSIMFGRGDLDKQYLLLGIIAKEDFKMKVAVKNFNEAVIYNRHNSDALFQLAFASDSYFKDKKIALNHYQRYIQKFENKSPKLTEYANRRITEIKKEYFLKGEIVE
jgi:tetratricopeptide (TPR) repeat protein